MRNVRFRRVFCLKIEKTWLMLATPPTTMEPISVAYHVTIVPGV